MCGGRGTRLGTDTEKPLVPVAGRPMVDRVHDALATSGIDRVVAAVSPHTPATRAHLDGGSTTATEPLPTVVETSGQGYVADLDEAMDRGGLTPPVLTVAADLPLLDGAVVDRVLATYTERNDPENGDCSLSVCVPAERVRALGATLDTSFAPADRELAPTGVNVVGDPDLERRVVLDDPRLAVNVNRPRDWRVADRRLRDRETANRETTNRETVTGDRETETADDTQGTRR
jgi:adenosylcobinamide-phosphate guanylyltransferase